MRKLSIIIPVFNEKETIEEIIKRVVVAPTLNYEKEIIVVDDGSDDGTENILENLKEKYNFLFLRHLKNLGKGAAIKTGLEKVTGELVLIQDADLEYDPNDYPELLKAISPNYPVIYGSRNLNRKIKRGYFLYFLGGKMLGTLMNILFRSHLTDVMTCYKLLPVNVLKSINLESNKFDFEIEVTAKILKLGYHIKEVPIRYYPRKFSQGKKIRFWDGLIAFLAIIKYRIKHPTS